uniref:Uncharacterized protein n=1 Tax=Salarias fasciatus TaxID=181472 RepID=A0A672ITV3_SALFA
MLEWIRTSYFKPSAANLWPVSSACSRPGVRILSLSLLPLRLYWECLMRRMLRVALGLPLSCSELGSSVALSFFLPLDRADGSLLGTLIIKIAVKKCHCPGYNLPFVLSCDQLQQ